MWKESAGRCDRGGSPQKRLRGKSASNNRRYGAGESGVCQLRLRHPGARCEASGRAGISAGKGTAGGSVST